jgi:uncharacterized protein with HEPN domain
VPPTLGDRLAHIIEAIDNIQNFVAGKNLETISNDLTLRLALERSFEIICEASRHVPPEIKATEVEIDWRHMTDLGNLLRHAYHRVDVARLMKIAGTDLPPLKKFVERVLDEEKKR